MPNWCENIMIISHKDATQLNDLMGKVHDDPEGQLFQHIKPMPEELYDTISSDVSPNWLDWRVRNWGTKWDACNMDYSVNGETVQFTFDTAWSPPIGIFEALMEQGFEVEAYYIEWGMMFTGEWHTDTDDHTDGVYNIGEDEIPSHLDNEFGITEQLQEMEAEECEDMTAEQKHEASMEQIEMIKKELTYYRQTYGDYEENEDVAT